MAVASLALPLVDSIAKLLTETHSPFLVAWARYAAVSLFVLPFAAAHGGGIRALKTSFGPNLLRAFLGVSAMTCFFWAISEIPLATALGGYFIGPVVAAVLAARLLGEAVTLWRLAAVLAGVAGAFLIVRPGADFQPGTVLAIASGVLFGGYLVATRMMASVMPPVVALQLQCMLGMLLLTPLAIPHWSWPAREALVLILAMGALSTLCHFLVIAAFRHAETAVLSPLIYLELVTAVAFGWFMFSELPGDSAFIGIALIVAGGLAALLAERRRSSVRVEREIKMPLLPPTATASSPMFGATSWRSRTRASRLTRRAIVEPRKR
jgi:drug/metabolite transporter (DMT)-like permease